MQKDFTVICIDAGKILLKGKAFLQETPHSASLSGPFQSFEALAGNLNWFGEGSKNITTRNEHLLALHGVKEVARVKLLESEEALELFSRHAFSGNHVINMDRVLVDSFLAYVDWLPLALVVLGTFLRGRRELK